MSGRDGLYRVASAADWAAALAAGLYRGAAHDVRDGYLHLSTRSQVASTLAKHYAGQTDLVILTIDAERLTDPLRYEPSRGGDLFPHLYGVLPVTAVTAITAAEDWRE